MRKPPAHMHNPLKAKRKEITTCFKFFNRYLLFLYKQNCTDNFLNYYLPHFICSHDRLFTKVKTINITHGINEIARTSAPLARAAAALGAASVRPARQPASRRAAGPPPPRAQCNCSGSIIHKLLSRELENMYLVLMIIARHLPSGSISIAVRSQNYKR